VEINRKGKKIHHIYNGSTNHHRFGVRQLFIEKSMTIHFD